MTLQDALDKRGIRYRQSGDKIHLNCPWCPSRGKSPDTRMRLCVHAKDGWGRCMSCDWSRKTAVNAVLKQLGIVELVAGFSRADKPEAFHISLPGDFTPLWLPTTDAFDLQAQEYLRTRGITREQIRKYRLGTSYTDTYAYRILFPVYADHELKCINARDFTGRRKPKYLLSKGDKYLAFFDPEATCCVLSEGVIKALRIAQTTSDCSAALLGHDLTDIQLKQIQDSQCRAIILYPDTDAVGRKGFLKIADKLCENWKGEVAIVWPVTGAADDLPLRELDRLFQCNTVTYSPRLRHKIQLEK